MYEIQLPSLVLLPYYLLVVVQHQERPPYRITLTKPPPIYLLFLTLHATVLTYYHILLPLLHLPLLSPYMLLLPLVYLLATKTLC